MQDGGPDFLIIGAAKSSTTWLQASLQRAPDVFMPDPELHFFSREFDRGMPWYLDHFLPEGPGLLRGEKSNSYLTNPEAAGRISAALPNVRLVAMLRNPVSRAYSDYCMLFRRGEVGSDVETYLDPKRAEFRRFVDNGRYAANLARYLDRFPRESLLVLFFEEAHAVPQQTLDALAGHLGRGPGWLRPVEAKVKDRRAAMVPRRIRNVLHPLRPLIDPFRDTRAVSAIRGAIATEVTYPQMPAALVARLREFYADDVRNLEDLCGRSLGGWLDDVRI